MRNFLAEMKAKDYFCSLDVIEAKRVLFVMEQISGNERLNDVEIPEVKCIANLYGEIIQENFARELANKLANEYDNKHPGTLMTPTEARHYTEENHVKLLAMLGLRGFDYVMAVIRQGKLNVKKIENGIDEKQMLIALRWDEVRSNMEPSISNDFHRKSGLKLLGFDKTAEMLVEQSYIIANLYEQFRSDSQEVKMDVTALRRMKIHFIQAAELIEEFYQTQPPVIPHGCNNINFEEDSIVLSLAVKGQIRNSEAIINYYTVKSKWENVVKRLSKEFSREEREVIKNKSEIVKKLISSKW